MGVFARLENAERQAEERRRLREQEADEATTRGLFQPELSQATDTLTLTLTTNPNN